MGQHSNDLFRCDTASGERLVVRVCLPGGRSDAERDAELAWLAALARDTDLTVPVARFSTRVALRSFQTEGAASRSAGSRAGPAEAGLPGGWSRTWAGTWHADQLARRPIDPAVRCVLTETAERVQTVLTGLGQDRAGYGLIHADLDLDNVLDHHGQARVIDFDDASWGHYALDLAIAADGIPGALRPVLLGGYQTVRPLPPGYDEHQAALLAARRLFLAIWHLASGLPDERHVGQLRAFTGN